MKTNFHNKNFALSLAFILRLKATRKWPFEPKWYRVSMLRLLEDNVDKVLEIQRIPNVFQSEIVAQTFETI